MKFDVEARNADALTRALRKAGEDVADLADANRDVGGMIQRAAAARAPRRSGKLAASLRAQVTPQGVRVGVLPSIKYAGPIHWGWPARNIEAQPFLVSVAHALEPQWTDVYVDAVQTVLDDAARSV